MFEKLENIYLFIAGLLITFATFIYKRWNFFKEKLAELQTYNAVNTSQHNDFKEDITEIKRDIKQILQIINKK